MNKINLGLNVVLLAAVLFLFFRDQPESQSVDESQTEVAAHLQDADSLLTDSLALPGTDARIVYVDAEVLNTEYQFIIDKYEELEKEQMRIEKQVERKLRSAEERYLELESQAPTMTQSQLEQAQMELQQLQQEITEFQEKAASDFRRKEAAAQDEFFSNIRSFLQDYNKDGRYDYILTYQKGGQILLMNESYDITREVIDGLNDHYRKKQAPPAG